MLPLPRGGVFLFFNAALARGWLATPQFGYRYHGF